MQWISGCDWEPDSSFDYLTRADAARRAFIANRISYEDFCDHIEMFGNAGELDDPAGTETLEEKAWFAERARNRKRVYND